MTPDMTRSQAMRLRFERRQGTRRVCAVLFIGLSAAYLTWRLTILNPDAPILSALFYGAELIGFLLALLTIFLSWGMSDRKPGRVPQGARVDVFVPTFKEPIDVIRRTLEAAVAITYPHQTIVLDDGRRSEVKEVARALGCTYYSRPENRHAKAGNLNFGLGKSTAEFVLVLDADHIPQPDAIDRLIGYLDDQQVGLVQAPQDFYNLNALQFVNAPNGALWHDQSYFYSIIQSNADRFDGTTCVGTGVLYRRSALDAIGGIPEETVTEDLHTSLKMHKSGIATAFHPEPVAYGIGETKLSDYYNVRLRWGHGNIHALRHENVFFCKGLSWRQRLNYLMFGLSYLEGWQYLIFYLVPIYSLLTGVAPFQITFLNFLIILFSPIITYLLTQEFACGFGRYWVNELYSMMRFPIALAASFAVFRNKMSWRPSAKQEKGRVEWWLMTPQLAIIAMSLGALAFAASKLWGAPLEAPMLEMVKDLSTSAEPRSIHQEFSAGFSFELLIVAGFWALLNAVRGLLFVLRVIRAGRETHADQRFAVPLLVEIDGRTHLVSESSLSFLRLADPKGLATLPEPMAARLYVPGNFVTVELSQSSEGRGCFGMAFTDHQQKQILETALYSVRWHRDLQHRDAEFTTPIGFLANLFGLGPASNPISKHTPELMIETDGRKLLRFSGALENPARQAEDQVAL